MWRTQFQQFPMKRPSAFRWLMIILCMPFASAAHGLALHQWGPWAVLFIARAARGDLDIVQMQTAVGTAPSVAIHRSSASRAFTLPSLGKSARRGQRGEGGYFRDAICSARVRLWMQGLLHKRSIIRSIGVKRAKAYASPSTLFL